MTAIDIQQLHKSFGTITALEDVSLTVQKGELVALLGSSHSGKTTLLRILAGLEQPDSGSVLTDNTASPDPVIRASGIGYVAKNAGLFEHMRVFENIAFGLGICPKRSRLSKELLHERVMDLVELMHLEGLEDKLPRQLTKDQRWRAALARTLAVEPTILLLDEPFGQLDTKIRKDLGRWLRRLHEALPMTIVFATHDQQEAMDVADRVAIMDQGRIEQIGTPMEVYHTPASNFVYDFLGGYNVFTGLREPDGTIHLDEEDSIRSHRESQGKPAVKLGRYGEIGKLLERWLPESIVTKSAEIRAAANSESQEPSGDQEAAPNQPVTLYCRPHEMYIARSPEDGGGAYVPVEVVHMNPAGSLTKLELKRKSGQVLQADIPQLIIDELHVHHGDTLLVKPKTTRVVA